MPFKVPGRHTLSPRQTQLQRPLGVKGGTAKPSGEQEGGTNLLTPAHCPELSCWIGPLPEECPAWKGGQRATASGCHTLPGRVPVTRPPLYPGTWVSVLNPLTLSFPGGWQDLPPWGGPVLLPTLLVLPVGSGHPYHCLGMTKSSPDHVLSG